MSRYAEITDGVVTNIAVCDDPDFAATMGWVGPVDTLTPQPGVGWTYDGTHWAPPAPPPIPPQQAAAAQLQAMAATDIPAFNTQMQADAAAVTNWSSLTAAEQSAILGRMIGGFGAAMTAIQTHAVATGTLPPPQEQQP